MQRIDLSHVIEDGMITYKGLPAPVVCDFLSREASREIAAGIPICEHLTNLDALPAAGFRFSAVPVKLRGLGTFPVRSYAVL